MHNHSLSSLPPFFPFLFCAIVVFCAGFLLYALRLALKKCGMEAAKSNRILVTTAVGIVALLGLQGLLASASFFDFSAMPPRIPLLIIPAVIAVLLIARKKWFQELLLALPPSMLIWPQAMRIFVEICLWQSFVAGLIPEQMSFEGKNFDVFSGLLAIPAAILVAQRPMLGRLYNYLGLALLFTIVVIANLSAPTPFQVFKGGPAPLLLGEIPFVWLPGFVVPFAFAFHVFSLKQLSLLLEPELDGVKRLQH